MVICVYKLEGLSEDKLEERAEWFHSPLETGWAALSSLGNDWPLDKTVTGQLSHFLHLDL